MGVSAARWLIPAAGARGGRWAESLDPRRFIPASGRRAAIRAAGSLDPPPAIGYTPRQGTDAAI
ncbi:MAG: hypothetical protein JXA90_06120, partial [Planctomycetes bacterium]|nr:hypothetical protein [Planctomycetota bacterium]